MESILVYLVYGAISFLSLWLGVAAGFKLLGGWIGADYRSVGDLFSKSAILAGIWTIARIVLGFIPVPFLPFILALIILVISANAVFNLDTDAYLKTLLVLFVVAILSGLLAGIVAVAVIIAMGFDPAALGA